MMKLLAIFGFTDTSLATGAAESAEIWATSVWREAMREVFWGPFMKENDINSIIEVHTRLEKTAGDRETFTLFRELTGGGVTGDNTLEGNEEGLDWFSDTVTLDQIRNGVRLGGAMTEKRPVFDLANESKGMLKQWMATYLDDYVFTQMDDSPTSVHFGGDATSTADIDASDTITPALLDEAVASSMKADPKVWPIRVGGRAWYVVVIHPDVAYDLKQHATWTSAQRDATPRSKEENAIFSGAMGYWGGTAIYVSEKVPSPPPTATPPPSTAPPTCSADARPECGRGGGGRRVGKNYLIIKIAAASPSAVSSDSPRRFSTPQTMASRHFGLPGPRTSPVKAQG